MSRRAIRTIRLTLVAAAASAALAPGVSQALLPFGGAVFAGEHPVWAMASPWEGDQPIEIVALDGEGRRHTLFSLPADPGRDNLPRSLVASSRRIAFVRYSSPRWNPMTGRYESEDRRPGQVWASSRAGWRLVGETGGITYIDVEGDEVAFSPPHGGIEIVDERGATERIAGTEFVPQIRMAGRFVAYRVVMSSTPDSIVVHDRASGRESYRVNVPALFGAETTPYPANYDIVAFDVDANGTLAVVPRDLGSMYGHGPLVWFSVAEPVPHRPPVVLAGADLQLVDGLVAARSATFPENLVVDLEGRVVDRFNLRAAGTIAFDGRQYAWAATGRRPPLETSLHRARFPLSVLSVDAPTLKPGTVAFSISQPARVRLRMHRCGRVIARRCREPRAVADVRRRVGPGISRIPLSRPVRAKLRAPGAIRVVVEAVNASGKRARRATVVRR